MQSPSVGLASAGHKTSASPRRSKSPRDNQQHYASNSLNQATRHVNWSPQASYLNNNNNRCQQSQSQPLSAAAAINGHSQQQHQQQHQHQHQQQQQQLQQQMAQSTGAPASSRPPASQLKARVRAIKAKLLDSHGAELRRTLFSLRQTFQDEPDFVLEFIQAEHEALDCLMRVSSESALDQIHQNYMLRVLGQLAEHKEPLEALANHAASVEWLGSLLSSQHRLFVKNSLKLLCKLANHRRQDHVLRRLVLSEGGSRLWRNLVGLVKRVAASPFLAGLVSKQNNNCPSPTNNTSTSSQNVASNFGGQWQEEISILVDSLSLINNIFHALTSGFTSSPTKQQQSSHKTSQVEEEEEDDDQVEDDYESEPDIGSLSIDDRHIQNSDKVNKPTNNVDGEQEIILRQHSELFYDALEELNTQQLLAYFEDVDPKVSEQLRILEQQSNKFRHLNSKCDNKSISSNKLSANSKRQAKNSSSSSNNNYNNCNETSEMSRVLKQQQQQQPSTSSSTTSIASLTLSNTNYNSGSQHLVDGHKNKRPNFIVINKSGSRQGVKSATRTTTASNNTTKHNNSNNNANNVNNVQELARGKQRASTSSCSSSDSYGSGYASGSGNSTDHEQKEKLRLSSLQSTNPAAPNDTDGTRRHDADDDDDDEDEVEEEDEDVVDDDEVDENGERVVAGQKDQIDSQLLTKSQSYEASESRSRTITPTLNNKSSIDEQQLMQPAKPSLGSVTTNSPVTSPYKSHIHQLHSPARSSQSLSKSTASSDQSSISDNTNNCQLNLTSKSLDETTPIPHSPSLVANKTNSDNLISHNNISNSKTTTTTSLNVDQQHHQLKPQTTTTTSATIATPTTSSTTTSLDKQEPYYHTLFQWEQLVSKGVTRPLLINDLDFTDLRDEDDCDLLNQQQQHQHQLHNNAPPPPSGSLSWSSRNNNAPGEPLHIKIPNQQRDGQDQIDSGTSSGPNSGSPRGNQTPASAPMPPMPPPPMSPWFSTLTSSSRPQSQLLLSPTPSFVDAHSQHHQTTEPGAYNREESPVDSTYSNYSRNSFCVPQTSTPTQDSTAAATLNPRNNNQFNTLQPVTSLRSASSMSSLLFGSNGKYGSKRKKTMKLFWKEVREDRSLLAKLTKKKTIWDEIKPVPIDTQKLEYLFESKAKDLSLSRSRNGLDALNQRKAKITVLDTKRSNAINIGMTKLPPMRTIKSAILKMDSNIMNREGIEKILTTMMPTEEEKSRIIEAQLANPETPLGTAEQFLLNLASISALEARLKLWAFQLDYAQIEKEVAEPLMDLKQAIEEIEQSETFRLILGTLLSIGNFLNSSNVKGFQIDYLEKVPEVKDTVHKHSLLHHLCVFMQERYEQTGDLYSEFSAVNRASKIDYVEVGKNLKKMQQDCKASWDYLKIVAKHDGLANLMNTSNSVSANNSSSSSSASSSVHLGNSGNNGLHSSPLSASNSMTSSSSSNNSNTNNNPSALTPSSPAKPCGKLNNLSKLSMITTITSSDDNHHHNNVNSVSGKDQQQQHNNNQRTNSSLANGNQHHQSGNHSIGSNSNNNQANGQQTPSGKQMKTKVSDFLTDCAERIMVLMVIHRRVMNRFQKLLVYLGCPSHQIKQTQPQQVLKVINEFALEYRTKRERVREMILKRQQCQHHHHHYLQGHQQHPNIGTSRWQLNRMRWAGSQQYLDSSTNQRPCSTASSYTNNHSDCPDLSCCDSLLLRNHNCATGGANSSLTGNNVNNGAACNNSSLNSPYSDYLYNTEQQQASNYCQSRQQSVTPVPSNSPKRNHHHHLMSASMFDLQNQQQQQPTGGGNKFSPTTTNPADLSSRSNGDDHQLQDHDSAERIQQREKDEQLCRLLGIGKSFDGACSDLLKLSHWTTTSQRVVRHQPAHLQKRKQRAASIDCNASSTSNGADDQFNESSPPIGHAPNHRRQSWQNNSRYANSYSMEDDDLGQNSDEEIMQCLVRHANQSGRNSLGNVGGTRSSASVYGQPQRGKLIARDSNL